jgi:hypothetical protein
MIPAQRIAPNVAGFLLLQSGQYGRDLAGRWWARPPGEDAMMLDAALVSLSPNGTITYIRDIQGYRLDAGSWRKT